MFTLGTNDFLQFPSKINVVENCFSFNIVLRVWDIVTQWTGKTIGLINWNIWLNFLDPSTTLTLSLQNFTTYSSVGWKKTQKNIHKNIKYDQVDVRYWITRRTNAASFISIYQISPTSKRILNSNACNFRGTKNGLDFRIMKIR